MRPPVRRRLLVLLIAVLVVLTALVAIGVYGLIRGPRTSGNGPAGTMPTSLPSPRPTNPTGARLPVIDPSNDPVTYAKEVAEALFTWDTASGHSQSEYVDVVIREAAPAGDELNGLVADLDGYYPTAPQWRQLLGYETSQSLTIESAAVPDSWPEILGRADSQLVPGTVAVTIRGQRQREGQWNEQEARSTHEVAFTVFVLCPKDADRCTLLRLSGLGTPLE